MPENFQPVRVVDGKKGPELEVSFDRNSRLGKLGQDMERLESYLDSQKATVQKLLDSFSNIADKEHRPWYWTNNEAKYKQCLQAYAEKMNNTLASFVPRITEIHTQNPQLFDVNSGNTKEQIDGVIKIMGPKFETTVVSNMNLGIADILKEPKFTKNILEDVKKGTSNERIDNVVARR